VKHGRRRTRKSRHAGHRLSNEEIEKVRLSLLGVVATCELVRSSFAASRCTGIVLTRGALQPLREALTLLDRGEAFMVLEIFGKFADGMSARTIAADFNARRIPSPGASWNRTQRRAAGWMGSAIRVIVRNERYRGVIHRNASEWRKDPDSGKRKRVVRPRSEWISYVDESLRIVSDDLWNRAQRRMQPAKDDKKFKTGGRPKFLLSGLLVCDACGSHNTVTDQRSYGCSSHHDGRACSNSVRVRRDRIETILLDPIRKELLTPERVEQMAKEMQAYYLDRVRAMQTRAVEQPQELQELTARIERLRERL